MRFVYDYEDESGDFKIGADYLSGAVIELRCFGLQVIWGFLTFIALRPGMLSCRVSARRASPID
jgi:hypothetical protein